VGRVSQIEKQKDKSESESRAKHCILNGKKGPENTCETELPHPTPLLDVSGYAHDDEKGK